MPTAGSNTKVFLSYSHDSDDHRARVVALSERLRADGIETQLDQYVEGTPPRGWPRWMLDQLDWADFVLLVCTESYYRRFRGHDSPGQGRGADFEGATILQHIYDAQSVTTKFVPVVFARDDRPFIPEPVRMHNSYVVSDEADYRNLRAFLRGTAGTKPGAVGAGPPSRLDVGSEASPRSALASLDAQISQADQLRIQNRYAEARGALDEARRLLGTNGDPRRAARLETALGKVERNQGNVLLARRSFERALDLLAAAHGAAGSPVLLPERADASLQLGVTLLLQDDRANARREIENARRDYRVLIDRLGEGQATLELAELYKVEGNFEQAISHLDEAASEFETARDRLGLANVERTRGSIERLRDRTTQALPLLERALAAYRALDDRQGQVLALFEIGETYAQLERLDEAGRVHREAQSLADSIHFGLGVRNAYLALANVEAKSNRPKTAAEQFSRALDYYRSSGNKLGEAQAALGLGSVLIQLDDPTAARARLREAELVALSLRDAAVESNIRYWQAFLELGDGRVTEAAAGFRRAMLLADQGRDPMAYAKALQGLADAQARAGQKSEAEASLEIARARFTQMGMANDAAIAGLSLASLLGERKDAGGLALLDSVVGELEGSNRPDLLQLARQVRATAAAALAAPPPVPETQPAGASASAATEAHPSVVAARVQRGGAIAVGILALLGTIVAAVIANPSKAPATGPPVQPAPPVSATPQTPVAAAPRYKGVELRFSVKIDEIGTFAQRISNWKLTVSCTKDKQPVGHPVVLVDRTVQNGQTYSFERPLTFVASDSDVLACRVEGTHQRTGSQLPISGRTGDIPMRTLPAAGRESEFTITGGSARATIRWSAAPIAAERKTKPRPGSP